jgi:hypothetical protein
MRILLELLRGLGQQSGTTGIWRRQNRPISQALVEIVGQHTITERQPNQGGREKFRNQKSRTHENRL